MHWNFWTINFSLDGWFNILFRKNKSSIIPIGFWWLSLIGGVITFIYAKHINSFPFILAQGVGIIVYSREFVSTS